MTRRPATRRIEVLALIAYLLCLQNRSAAFLAPKAKRRPSINFLGRPYSNLLEATRVRDKTSSKAPVRRRYQRVLDSSDPSALTFSGEFTKTSRPLASTTEDTDRLIDFFKTTTARDLLFVSDSAPKPVSPITRELFEEWRAEAQSLGAATPDPETDAVFELSSDAINFSGLNVQTTVCCGAKLLETSEGFPTYEFVMIKDTTKANGPKFLLWIYNQVMDFAARYNTKSKNDKTTRSLCFVTLVEEGQQGVSIHFESSFQTKMNFPSFLIKILPISKERAEKQGSSAVRNFVEKGVERSLDRFEKAFKRY